MICAACGAENRPGGKSCTECGDTRAIALALEGSREAALDAARISMGGYRTSGVRLDEAFVALGVGAALQPAPEADDLLRRAREVFETVGAHGLLALVDGRFARGPRSAANAGGSAVDGSSARADA